MIIFAGGPFFDPLGFSRGDEQTFHDYKVKEVKHGRLAMLAFLELFAQYGATGNCSVYSVDLRFTVCDYFCPKH